MFPKFSLCELISSLMRLFTGALTMKSLNIFPCYMNLNYGFNISSGMSTTYALEKPPLGFSAPTLTRNTFFPFRY